MEETNSAPNKVMEVLCSGDKSAMKEIICNENGGNRELNQVLRIVNIDGSGPQDVDSRRKINKFFMNCLIETQLGLPEALIWVKKHLDPEFRDTLLSDLDYTGQYLKPVLLGSP